MKKKDYHAYFKPFSSKQHRIFCHFAKITLSFTKYLTLKEEFCESPSEYSHMSVSLQGQIFFICFTYSNLYFSLCVTLVYIALNFPYSKEEWGQWICFHFKRLMIKDKDSLVQQKQIVASMQESVQRVLWIHRYMITNRIQILPLVSSTKYKLL